MRIFLSRCRFVFHVLLWTLLVASRVAPALGAPFEWQTAPAEHQGMDPAKLQLLQEDLVERNTKALLIIRGDRIVLEWYSPEHGADQRHYTASLAKALVGGMSLALALEDGRIALDDPASKYIPAWKGDAVRSKITIRQLATHSSGVEDATAPASGKSHDALLGWKGDFWRGRSIQPTPEATAQLHDPFSISIHKAPVVFEPGNGYAYSNPGMALLAYAVTASLQGTAHTDIRGLLQHRVMEPIGVRPEAWSIGYNRTYPVDGLPVVANWGGGDFTARATARIGRLVLRKGNWQGQQLIAPQWVEAMTHYAGTALPARPPGNPQPAPALGWYQNSDGAWPDVPRDAVAGAGAGNQILFIVPSLDLIVVRNGGGNLGDAEKGEGFWGGAEKYLFNPVVSAVTDRKSVAAGPDTPPYPPSRVIQRLSWASRGAVRRRAAGSDNWPLTWAEDGDLYTAYGDGWGFEPRVPDKLSMGFARVEGEPGNFRGINIRATSGETVGQGPEGKKASGMLMVDGVLYAWVRNAGNSQLAWSKDRGKTWTWSDWKFTKSFGAPTFLNFGRNYQGARDPYVYTYSHDSDSAYTAADRMVLARVRRGRITEREAYEFFERLETSGRPVWGKDVEERGAIFEHPGECYRSGVTYNAALERYIWVQILPGAREPQFRSRDNDPRFKGGLGIYDAPEPWGPWTTVYFARQWDTGPGETASFPTKWISLDGLTMHLVFSGEDSFSVRAATLALRGAELDFLSDQGGSVPPCR